MAETAYFFDGVAYTEAQQADFQSRVMRPRGVFADSPFGVLAATATNGNRTVTVTPGEAMVQGFYYRNDANKILTIAANNGVGIRYDWIILELNRSANTLLATVSQGINGAGTPALVQTTTGIYQHPLAYVAVAAGATVLAPIDLADYREYSKWPETALSLNDGWAVFNSSLIVTTKSPNVVSLEKPAIGTFNVVLNANYSYIIGWANVIATTTGSITSPTYFVSAGRGGSVWTGVANKVQFYVYDVANGPQDADLAVRFKGIP